MAEYIKFGYEVGTGREVLIPLHHTIVTGITQLAGKCLSGDDIIICADGSLVSVKEAYDKKLKPRVLSLGDDYKLHEDEIVAIVPNGVKEVFMLETDDGTKVKLTGNHPVLTPSGWRMVAELKPGDWVALPRILPIRGEAQIPDSAVKIIAYMLAEGTLNLRSPRFTNSDARIVRDLEEALMEHGLRLRKVSGSDIDYHVVQIRRRERPFGRSIGRGPRKGVLQLRYGYWRRFCEMYGLKPRRSREKEIPEIIFRLNKRQVALFLNRYFAGDGYAYIKRERVRGKEYLRPIVGFTSSSPKVLDGLRILLLRFGIKTVKRKNEILIATCEDVAKFIDEIGGFTKEGILYDIKRSINPTPKHDTIPIKIPRLRRFRNKNLEKWYRDGSRSNPTRTTLLRVASLTRDKELALLAESDIWWRRIKSVKPAGFEETYDVQVARNHNLVVNGIIVHNTTAIEGMIFRSRLTAMAFRIKRGEAAFTFGRKIRPVFKERTDWRFIEALIEAIMREPQRYNRAQIIKACRGAKTLEEVWANIKAELGRVRKGSVLESIYTNLDAYFEIVVPKVKSMNFADSLDLRHGVNVVDLEGWEPEVQSLVVASCMEEVGSRHRDVVVVVPEAWEFVPSNRKTPVKLAAERIARMGAAVGNLLWLDSQNLMGVDANIRSQLGVWILGVQRYEHEVERTLKAIPLPPSKKPKAHEVMNLRLGEFYVVTPEFVTKAYAQPAWMGDDLARRVALGGLTPEEAREKCRHSAAIAEMKSIANRIEEVLRS